jgi:hypothetical protein
MIVGDRQHANQVAGFLGTAKVGSEADLVAFDQWGQDVATRRCRSAAAR